MDSSAPRKTYTERFWDHFPFYLSIGMSAEQYWDGDCWLTKSYRDAHEQMLERQSMLAWLQGRYFYEALCDVSPLLHAFSKKGAKPAEYCERPYPITPRGVKQKEKEAEKATYEQGKAKMQAFAEKINKKFNGE